MKTIVKRYHTKWIAAMALLCVLGLSQLYAQQDSQYTKYMYNTQVINPAYAGSHGRPTVLSTYRTQWVGLEGAPETLALGFNAPTSEFSPIGLGLNFYRDELGPANESAITGDFSYTIVLGNEVQFAFGLKGGFNLLDVDYSVLNIFDPSDELQQVNIDNRLTPIIGAGLYLHNNESWYVGLSIPNVLETTHYDDTSVSNASEKAAVYAIGGYVFDIGPNTKFKPAVLGKFVSGSPIALDLSANFLFNEKFTLGASYRFDAAVSALAGFQITDSFFAGYAYDYGIQELVNYNSGSHEVFLRFSLGRRNPRRLTTPRFF